MGREDNRGKWHNSMEFMMSCLGYSVGTGSLWRYPYVAMRNGGGAYFILSVLFTLLVGIPVLILEMCIGQYYSLSPLKFWTNFPLFQGVGDSIVALCTVLSIYYNTVTVWTLFYTVMCFQHPPPWTTCGHSWNTEGCIATWDLNGTLNASVVLLRTNTSNGRPSMLSTEEFWTYNVLDLSPGFGTMGTLRWQMVLCVFAAWVIVFVCLCKGVFSSRIAIYITAPAPFILLTILLVRAALLPGSADGVSYFLTPDWERFKSLQVWIEAFLMGLYAVGNGYGTITDLGSYSSFHSDSVRLSVIIGVADILASVYCGFTIFTVLGYMAYESGVPVSEIRNSGPGLIFITYPHTASLLPVPQLWSVIFFLTCFFLAIDSQFGAFKTVTSGLFDFYPSTLGRHKVLVTLIACGCGNLLGLIFVTQGGMYYYQITDWYSAALGSATIVLFQGVAIAWVYGADRFGDNMRQMMPKLSPKFLAVTLFHWKYVLPAATLVVFVATLARFKPPTLNDYVYPAGAIALGWIIATGIVLPIPAMMVYRVLVTKGTLLQTLIVVWGVTLARWLVCGPCITCLVFGALTGCWVVAMCSVGRDARTWSLFLYFSTFPNKSDRFSLRSALYLPGIENKCHRFKKLGLKACPRPPAGVFSL